MKTVKVPAVNRQLPAKTNTLKAMLYSKGLAPYLFVSPFLITFIAFFVYPFIDTFVMSFQEVLPSQVTFIGPKNYIRLFNDPTFFVALSNTIEYTFWTLVVLIPLPLLLAVLLNSRFVLFKNLFRASMFVPALISTIVAGIVFSLMFGEMDTALINSLLVHLGFSPKQWLTNEHTAMFLMVLLAVWRWLGVNIVYFLSGLQGIPHELYESAEMDGAGALKKFFHITLPLLKPVTVYVLTISIIGGFRMFEESYVYWQGNSPANIGLTLVGYIYKQGLAYNDMGFGAAVGLVLLVIILIASLLSLKFTGTFQKEAD